MTDATQPEHAPVLSRHRHEAIRALHQQYHDPNGPQSLLDRWVVTGDPSLLAPSLHGPLSRVAQALADAERSAVSAREAEHARELEQAWDAGHAAGWDDATGPIGETRMVRNPYKKQNAPTP